MGEEQVVKQELEGWDYIVKFSEKLTFICLNVLNKKEITDDDYALLRPIFRAGYNGEHPLYETKLILAPQTVTESGLFAKSNDTLSENDANTTDGITFADTVIEPIKTDNND